MAYAVQADVDALVAKYAPSVSTFPSTTQSALLIDGVNDEIDTTLASVGLTVPVTTPAYFVDYLAFLNSLGAAAAQVRSMFPDAIDGGSLSVWQFLYDWYRYGLERLAAGGGIPTDVPTSGALLIAPSTYLTNNPDTELHLGDIAEPFFKRLKEY